MKVKSYLLAASFALSSLSVAHSQAPGSEQPGANPPPPPQNEEKDKDRPRDRKMPGFMANLPPEVRERFSQAREKALEDPKIQELRKASEQANKAFFDAMRAKMQEIDPGLAEIIKKNAPNGKMGGRDNKEGREGRGRFAGFENLTEAERAQLMAAREKAKDDPAVIAAKVRREAANTPEERQAAGEAHRKAMNDALIKIDPTLEPVLKKLGPPVGEPPSPPPGPGDQMGPS